MKYEKGLVSIIMPLYNSEKFIAQTIESVCKQQYTRWQLIICDDCSTDNSFAIVEGIAQTEPRIILIKSDKNLGTASARNKALERAEGQYISFLDSDDSLYPDYLNEQLRFLSINRCAIVTGSYLRISDKTASPFIVPTKISYKSILRGNPISCLTTLYDRTLIGERFFDLSFKKCEDYVFWLDILNDGYIVSGNMRILAEYRILPSSKSRNKLKLVKPMWHVYRKSQHINLCGSLCHMFEWMIYGINKYKNVR